MKRAAGLLAIIGFFLFSCNVEKATETDESGENQSVKKMMAEREEVKEDLNQLKVELDNKIEVLSRRIEGTSGKVKSDLEVLSDKLKVKKREIEVVLKDVENASEASWDEIRSKAQRTVDDIQDDIKGLDFGSEKTAERN